MCCCDRSESAASPQRDRIFNIGISASRLAGVLEAGGSEKLLRRVTVNHRVLRSVDIDANLGADPLPVEFCGLRSEYEATGMLRSAQPLADPSVLERVSADAPWFAAAVDELRRTGRHRVPYAFTPALEELARDPALVAVVEEILGDDRWVAWGANIQIGTPNAAFEWHNDIESMFWPSITVVVGISGCTADNATRYVPGSHRLPVGPPSSGDPTDGELVLALARELDPRCDSVVRFDGFGDGMFTVFDANGWHRGDAVASTDRLAAFLHYQRADDLRIPYMSDFTTGSWFDEPAAYLPNPCLEGDIERGVAPPPGGDRPSRGGLARVVARVARIPTRR